MQTQLTRPGVLPSVLLHSSPWNAEAVRKVSFEDASWRAILVSDETGPVGAVCYSEPSIYPQITVDAVVMHPERAENSAQVSSVVEACLPILRQVAERFRAKRIVFEAVDPALRAVLSGYGAREDSVTLSLAAEGGVLSVGMAYLAPNAVYDEAHVVTHSTVSGGGGIPSSNVVMEFVGYKAKCGRPCASKAGKAAHERHCQKCKEA